MLAKISMQDAWTLLDIAQAAEAKIAEIGNGSPLDSEISEEDPAEWYLVKTFPGDDMRALRWLARRRFGVFRPMQQRRLRKNGMFVQGWEPVFPGWLFVFCWAGSKMRKRIAKVPGVASVLSYPNTDKPIIIGQGFIDEMRALSWVYDDRAPNASNYVVRGQRQANRRRTGKNRRKEIRKETETIRKLKKSLKHEGKFDPSTWEQAKDLAPAERIAFLTRTLQGPAVVGSMSSGCGG